MNELIHKNLQSACQWLTEIAQVKSETKLENENRRHKLNFYAGSIKGEYYVAKKEWLHFCPVWHTGQAVKALLMSSSLLDDEFMPGAIAAGDFLLANQLENGALLAYEDLTDAVNITAILEALDGLFMLADKTGEDKYRQAAVRALDFCADKAYVPEESGFRDCYRPENDEIFNKYKHHTSRPLLDDGVYLTGWKLTGNQRYLDIALACANRLLDNESPEGNWLCYGPSKPDIKAIHPRHAYWWGAPMLKVYRETKDKKYLEQFKRCINWYRQAINADGGMVRNVYADLTRDSFGHAFSGSACALSMFIDYYNETADKDIISQINAIVKHSQDMQFNNPSDSNLRGALLEKILKPDGTDKSPYHIRDLATIFYIQAISKYLKSEI
jgi:rhamnogalacturonyl hydrolase YesR